MAEVCLSPRPTPRGRLAGNRRYRGLHTTLRIHHVDARRAVPSGPEGDHPAVRRPGRSLIGPLVRKNPEVRAVRPDSAYLEPPFDPGRERYMRPPWRPVRIRVVGGLVCEPPRPSAVDRDQINVRIACPIGHVGDGRAVGRPCGGNIISTPFSQHFYNVSLRSYQKNLRYSIMV